MGELGREGSLQTHGEAGSAAFWGTFVPEAQSRAPQVPGPSASSAEPMVSPVRGTGPGSIRGLASLLVGVGVDDWCLARGALAGSSWKGARVPDWVSLPWEAGCLLNTQPRAPGQLGLVLALVVAGCGDSRVPSQGRLLSAE